MEKRPTRIHVPRFRGVYYRDSTKFRHMGKPDRCFDICYRDARGRLIWEKVGWVSEGYNATIAASVRAERLQAIRHGKELPPKKGQEPTIMDVWQRYDEWVGSATRRPKDDRFTYTRQSQVLPPL